MPKSRMASKGPISGVLNALDHEPLLTDAVLSSLKRLWKTFQVLVRKRDDTALFIDAPDNGLMKVNSRQHGSDLRALKVLEAIQRYGV